MEGELRFYGMDRSDGGKCVFTVHFSELFILLIILSVDLKTYRGGCIVCVDYYYYSKNPDFFGLLVNYADISKVLIKKYLAFEKLGYGPEKVFVFGFSFGARLALELGHEINKLHNGTNLISRMDGEFNGVLDGGSHKDNFHSIRQQSVNPPELVFWALTTPVWQRIMCSAFTRTVWAMEP